MRGSPRLLLSALKRQHLLDTGDAAERVLTEIVHHKPFGWNQDVERLHDLLQRHGADALNRALRTAVDLGRFRRRDRRALLPTEPPSGRSPVTDLAFDPATVDISHLAKQLHLAFTRRAWKELVARAEVDEWTYAHFLGMLLLEETAQRRNTRIQLSVRRANLPMLKTLRTSTSRCKPP